MNLYMQTVSKGRFPFFRGGGGGGGGGLDPPLTILFISSFLCHATNCEMEWLMS